MKKRAPKILLYLIVAGICIILMPLAAKGHEKNVLRDIHVNKTDEYLDILLLLKKKPHFTFDKKVPRGRELIIHNTQISPRFEQRVLTGEGKFVEVDTAQGPDLRIIIKCGHVIRGVDYAWLKEKNILLLRLKAPKPDQKPKPVSDSPVDIKKIRFGVKKRFTRTVFELTDKPQWGIFCKDRLIVHLYNCRNLPTKKRYGPLRRIKGMWLKPEGRDLNILVNPSVTLDDVKVFWLDMGNRLVVDIYENPVSLASLNIKLPPDFGKPLAVAKVVPLEDKEGNDSPAKPDKAFVPIENPIPLKEKPKKPIVVKKIERQGQVQQSLPGNTKPRISPQEELFYGRIVASENFKEYQKGIELIDQFIAKFPNSALVEDLTFLKGHFYFQLLDGRSKTALQKTLQCFQAAINKYPNSKKVPLAYLKMAQACRIAGNYYDAVSYLNLLLERFHDETILPNIYLERGRVYTKIHFPDKAFQDFNTVVKKYPYSSQCNEARYGIAKYLHNKGLYEEADRWFRKILDNDSEFPIRTPEFFLVRGKNYLYLKKYGKARELFFKAINIGDAGESTEEILTRIGDTYLYQENKELAKKVYTYVVTHFPSGEGVSIAELRLADLSSKIEAFKKLHERYQDAPIGELALLKLANVYYRNKVYNKALETLEQVVLKPPKDEGGKAARALFLRTCERAFQEYSREKEFEKLVSLYTKYEEILHKNLSPSSQLLLAEAYNELEQPDKAIKAFKAINEKDLYDTQVARYVVGLAKAYDEAGKPEKAIKFLLTNIGKIKDKNIKARVSLYLADLYRRQSQFDNALKLYEKIAQSGILSAQKKELAGVYFHMGRIYNSKRRPDNAANALKQAISILDKETQDEEMRVSALIELSKSYRYKGDMSKAVALVEKVLKQGYGPDRPQYWDLKFLLAESYMSQGKVSKAETIYKEISDEGPERLQSRAQMRLGAISLDRELKKLSYWSESKGRSNNGVVSR